MNILPLRREAPRRDARPAPPADGRATDIGLGRPDAAAGNRVMRRLVVVLGVGAICSLLALVGWWMQRTYDQTQESVLADARALARSYAAYTARLLQSTDEMNRDIAAWFDLGIPGEEIELLLRGRKAVSPALMDLLVLDREGQIRYWTGSGSRPDVRDRGYFSHFMTKRDQDWFVDAPMPSRVHIGRWFFSFSRAVREADGQLARVVVAILDAAYFDQVLAAFPHRRDARVTLRHASGRTVAYSDGSIGAARGAVAEARRAGALVADDRLGWVEGVDVYPLSVAVEIDRELALRPWYGRLTVAALGLVMGCGTILALTFALSRNIARMEEAEGRYRALVEQSLVGIFIIRDGVLNYVNPRLAEIFGFAPSQMIGLGNLGELVAREDRKRVAEQFDHWLRGEDSGRALVFSGLRRDGTTIDLEAQGRPVELGDRTALLGMITDVTDKQRAQRQLQFLAFHDALTELPNRSLFFDRLNQAIYLARRSQGQFATLVIDLDGFKPVNDTHGHEAGDATLQAVARRLSECVRESDTVARMGGDEFGVVLHAVGGADDAIQVARKILHELARPIDARGATVRIGGSIGIALFPSDGDDMEGLMAAADMAMYAAKARGKNTYSLYEAGASASVHRQADLIEWKPEYDVGIALIDTQHRELCARINTLSRAITAAEPPERLLPLIEDLVGFARMHFDCEEALMSKHGVAGAHAHKRYHELLCADLMQIQERFEEVGLSRTLHEVKEWLLHHVTSADRELARALKARGVV